MGARKDSLRLPTRTPAYVDREVGAAELRISPDTWDKWVAEGRLPKPSPGFPTTTPRWRWADVDAALSGAKLVNSSSVETMSEEDTMKRYYAAAELYRNAPKKGRRRDLAAS
ncbi:hypothetical protein C7450_10399 [Chelatococcus asaccharovorans]|uniref:Uncharacterized protein n=1 Tax=Chelatococcus asaccharovorans TaxID=28210 RepID=A0A2V3UC96_9HYPH|nr:hypothetical protein C7450_10399 [Chelatococcus asaccharovorans]